MKFIKMIIISLISLVWLSGCGKIEIVQNRTTVELGEKIKLKEIVSYEPKKISSVAIASDGGFDSDKLGKYEVKYIATTPKGKSGEFTFDISVIDTVAPKLEFDKTDFKIAKGSSFDIDSRATITDKDQNVELKTNGNLNLEKEGEYTVDYIAVDSSGNESEPVKVKISVVDRSGADFRNACFGDDAATIKDFETLNFDSLHSTNDVLIFNGEDIGGVACEVTYLLDDTGKMETAFYSNNKTNGTECIEDYNKWVDLLKNKYGEPDKQLVNELSSLARYCTDDGQALELGYVQYWTEYDKENVIISCYADSNNYKPFTVLRYEPKKKNKSSDSDGL